MAFRVLDLALGQVVPFNVKGLRRRKRKVHTGGTVASLARDFGGELVAVLFAVKDNNSVVAFEVLGGNFEDAAIFLSGRVAVAELEVGALGRNSRGSRGNAGHGSENSDEGLGGEHFEFEG